MADYDRTNTFALFDNDQKESEKHADKTGYVNIDGKEYWLNGWNRSNGVIGGSVKEKVVADSPKKDTVVEPTEEDIDLSSIPF